jgi:hypothetical protein
MPDQTEPGAVMRLYPRRTLWGRKRWWYDCSACGTTSGPFADQETATSDVGQHAAERHQPEPDDTDLTEADVDRMMADGTPVQIVAGPTAAGGQSWTAEQHAGHGSPCETRSDGTCANPAPESGLRERYAEAIADATGNNWPAQAFLTEADAVLAVRDAELEQLRAELARVCALAERWDRDAPPPGNRPLTELRAALDPPQEQP